MSRTLSRVAFLVKWKVSVCLPPKHNHVPGVGSVLFTARATVKHFRIGWQVKGHILRATLRVVVHREGSGEAGHYAGCRVALFHSIHCGCTTHEAQQQQHQGQPGAPPDAARAAGARGAGVWGAGVWGAGARGAGARGGGCGALA